MKHHVDRKKTTEPNHKINNMVVCKNCLKRLQPEEDLIASLCRQCRAEENSCGCSDDT